MTNKNEYLKIKYMMDNMERATIRPGAFFLVLQISRIVGVAPICFKKLRDRYSISVSRFQLAYSVFLITAFNVVGLIGMFLKIKDKKHVDLESQSGILLMVLERMSCILASGMGYMGAIRMKNMINHINLLEKIRTKINYGHNFARDDKNVMWMSIFIIFTNVIGTLVDSMLSTICLSEWDFGVILLAIHYLQFNILIGLKVQIVNINFEVYKVLRELNEKLRYICTLANSGIDRLTTPKTQAIKNGVRSLTQCYVSVCEVVNKINNADGLYMFLIYTSFAFYSVFDGYRFIIALIKPRTPYQLVDIILQSCWCILIFVRPFFFVEPYQRISAQVAKMKVLLAQLMYVMTPLGSHVSVEFDIMFKQVMLNVPKYSPLDIITLNRSLITITLNAILTFLVFIIQRVRQP